MTTCSQSVAAQRCRIVVCRHSNYAVLCALYEKNLVSCTKTEVVFRKFLSFHLLYRWQTASIHTVVIPHLLISFHDRVRSDKGDYDGLSFIRSDISHRLR